MPNGTARARRMRFAHSFIWTKKTAYVIMSISAMHVQTEKTTKEDYGNHAKKKVKFVHSMMLKLISLFVSGIVLSAVLLMSISISQTQKSIRSLVQNYMLSCAETNGYILNTVIAMQGEEVLGNAQYLDQILSSVKVEGMDSSYAYLVSADGTMLYHPTAEKIGSPVENEVVTKLVADLKQGVIAEPACVAYEFNGVVKYASYYIHSAGEYILVVTADEADAFRSVTHTRNVLIALLLVVIIVFQGVGLLIIRKMVRPLQILTGVVDKVADLDLSVSGEEEKLSKRKDEIGLIAKAVENLHRELREIISVIQSQGAKLSESNMQFVQGFSEIVQTMDNVNVAVEEIASGSTSQAQETSTASEHIVDIGNAIESNSTSVGILEDSIQKMSGLATESEEVLNDLARINDWTADTINIVSEQTDRTNQSVEKINEAVVAIQDIASQTNLLSLNASIEAARAGESGRGFAVVAEQIRKLAEDSASSAEQIEAIVQELIANSEDGVSKMHDLSEASKVQAERLDQTKVSFNELQKEIKAVSHASKEIFDQTSAINNLKNGVSSVIEQLAAIAEENAASTQETSASMYTLTENIDRCKDETTVLSDLSAQLNEQAKKFRF